MTTVHQPPDVAALLALNDERDRYQRACLAWARDEYERGRRDGIEIGRRLEAAEMDAAWNRIAKPIARGGPTFAEIEARRWTVRGEQRTRETYGQPHPDDYTPRRPA